MSHQIKLTADGSSTIYLPELDEHYHSVHGAMNESMHVFIHSGMDVVLQRQQKQINILEIGLGTGLNALLTFRTVEKENVNVFYHALEPFPIGEEIYRNLNYTRLPGLDNYTTFFEQIHTGVWNEDMICSAHFTLHKSKTKLEAIEFNRFYDLVYFDAFAPGVQPDIWSVENFKKIFHAMNTNAILVTYCSKGEVRRNMAAAGLHVEKLQGPPGKREMVRAVKG